jgi:hypothetical protein
MQILTYIPLNSPTGSILTYERTIFYLEFLRGACYMASGPEFTRSILGWSVATEWPEPTEDSAGGSGEALGDKNGDWIGP